VTKAVGPFSGARHQYNTPVEYAVAEAISAAANRRLSARILKDDILDPTMAVAQSK
jgi:hypothetical protein